jgi:hypothetical protein
MTKIRKTLISTVTTAIVATSLLGAFTSAQAREMQGMRHHGNFNRHHGGHHGGGFGRVGTGFAIGLGVGMIGSAIAAAQAAEHQKIHGDAVREGWNARNQRRHDCHLVREWEKLVKSAEDLLQRDIQLNKNNPEHHSIEHVRFQEKEVERRKEELKRAKARCV